MAESNGGRRGVAALLFLTSAMTTLDAYSTLNSSPWTAESFGADQRRADSNREYVRHAITFSMGYAAASAWIARSPMPILGAAVANAYLWWLYERALERGRVAGSSDWASAKPGRGAWG